MKFFNDILYYLSVPKCVNCGNRLAIEELALCPECKREYDDVLERTCSICSRHLYECDCTNKYLDAHYVHHLIKVYRYLIRDIDLPTNKLIYSLKRDYRSDTVAFLSCELAKAIKASVKNPEECIFTSIPRRRASIIKYGMDHAQLLSRRTAKILGAEYKNLLNSRAKTEQKKAGSREGRLKNTTFKIKNESVDLTGKRVILVDDLVTTGASMGTAAMLIKSLGAKSITGAAIAIAYKDNGI